MVFDMDRKKIEILLEIVNGILEKIHQNLCHQRRFEEAKETVDIMRRVILLSEKLEGK